MLAREVNNEDIEVIAYGEVYAGPETNDRECEYKIMKAGYRYSRTEEDIIGGENRQVKVYRRGNKEIRIAV